MVTHRDNHGVVRQDHYGSGRQPWDDILDSGWAPEFAAGNVLKYLRRDKAREHSLESARWYYRELLRMCGGHSDRAPRVVQQLLDLLTAEEVGNLRS